MALGKRDLFEDFLRNVSISLEEYSDEESTEEFEKPYLVHLIPTDCADYRFNDEVCGGTHIGSETCSLSDSSKTSLVDHEKTNCGKKTPTIDCNSDCQDRKSGEIKADDKDGSVFSSTIDSDNSERCNLLIPSEQKVAPKTKLRKCLLCQQPGYLLDNNLTKLRFIDELKTRDLSVIFSAVEEPWVVTSVRVKSNGNLVELPEKVSRFDHLNSLTVRHNQLEDLPMSLKTLVHLRNLDLAHNNFEEVPEVIYSIKLLTNVNLKDNKIRFISSSILDLHGLKSFDVSLNPMVSPPCKICDKGVEAILEQIRFFSKKRLETPILQKNM